MEKALWPKWSITLLFLAPMEKAPFYDKLLFELVIVMVKDNKMQHKRSNVSQNLFYALHEVDKSNVTSSF